MKKNKIAIFESVNDGYLYSLVVVAQSNRVISNLKMKRLIRTGGSVVVGLGIKDINSFDTSTIENEEMKTMTLALSANNLDYNNKDKPSDIYATESEPLYVNANCTLYFKADSK